MTRRTRPEDDHFFRVEVTVAASIETPEGHSLGDNMIDGTLGFSMSMAHPPAGMSDAEINRNLSHHISPILAAIQIALTSIGFAILGPIDGPTMVERSHPTGETGFSDPVSVILPMPSTGEARA